MEKYSKMECKNYTWRKDFDNKLSENSDYETPKKKLKMINLEEDEELTPKKMKKEDFKLLEQIGKGTFGVVYKAEKKFSSSLYAIKKVYHDPNQKSREFEIMTEMRHKNCIRILGYYHTNEGKKNIKKPYLNIIMLYIKKTLYKVIRYYRKKQMDFPNSLGKIYTYQIFRGLSYIHSKNIIHRDIKPQNILISIKKHQLFFCDFGSAKKFKKKGKSISYICSRYYRAPELILEQERYGFEIDIWSAGCVIAEMFLGEPIFMGKNNKEQMRKIIELLGTPNSADLDSMVGGCRKKEFKFEEKERQDLKKVFRKGVDPLLIDLIGKVLVYDPGKRLKPVDAMMHGYFDELREGQITVNGRSIVDLFDFQSDELGENYGMLKKLVPDWKMD